MYTACAGKEPVPAAFSDGKRSMREKRDSRSCRDRGKIRASTFQVKTDIVLYKPWSSPENNSFRHWA